MRAAKYGMVWLVILPSALLAQPTITVTGRVVDPQGHALPGASVEISIRVDSGRRQLAGKTSTGPDGSFAFNVSPVSAAPTAQFEIRVEAAGFHSVTETVTIGKLASGPIEIRMTQVASATENLTVTADVNELDVSSPDPAMKVFASENLLDANPGRPGAPISISS